MNIKNSQINVSKRGSIRGVISALLGSLLFTLANGIAILIYAENLEAWAFGVLLIVLVISILFSVVPGFYGGRWLVRNLDRDRIAGALTIKRSLLKGVFLGVLMGFCICTFTVAFFYYRGNFEILVYRVVSALIISGVMGGWTGLKLKEDLERDRY